MFRRVYLCRAFELNAQMIYGTGIIKMPIYLSLGQESIAAALSVSFPHASIFAQHRCHDTYLAFGGDISALIDELLHRPTGCAGGMGGSASIHSPAIKMFGHDGHIGTQVPISVGYALATSEKTLTVFGDAAAEEDYVLGALGYAAHKKLPILFVCVDNGLSILTKVSVRRNWTMVDVARAFGLAAEEITDDPWLIMYHVLRALDHLPAFLNIHTVRHLWHAGSGKDSEPEWNRFNMVKEELVVLGLSDEVRHVEKTVTEMVNKKWAEATGGIEL